MSDVDRIASPTRRGTAPWARSSRWATAGKGAAATQLGFAGLIVGSDPDVDEYVRKLLGPLLDYDERRGTDLVGTLAAYFAAGGSPRTRPARCTCT